MLWICRWRRRNQIMWHTDDTKRLVQIETLQCQWQASQRDANVKREFRHKMKCERKKFHFLLGGADEIFSVARVNCVGFGVYWACLCTRNGGDSCPRTDDWLMHKSINDAKRTFAVRGAAVGSGCVHGSFTYQKKQEINKICPSIINEKNHKMEFWKRAFRRPARENGRKKCMRNAIGKRFGFFFSFRRLNGRV